MQVRDLRITPSMSYEDMREYAAGLGVTVCTHSMPKRMYGYYSERMKIIMIDESMNATERRCVLAHELIHWQHADPACDMTHQRQSEIRARRLAAAFLIPSTRAEMLIEEYEGNLAPVIRELNVTPQMFRDYQQLVLPRTTLI